MEEENQPLIPDSIDENEDIPGLIDNFYRDELQFWTIGLEVVEFLITMGMIATSALTLLNSESIAAIFTDKIQDRLQEANLILVFVITVMHIVKNHAMKIIPQTRNKLKALVYEYHHRQK